jgi:uroporphyrinogen-III synthase
VSRPIAVLRPEPGNRVTAAAIEARGRQAIRLPLFEVRPLAWEVPDPARFDALVLTSANAVRHAGTGLADLLHLPVHAVGRATAEAAVRAGFEIAAIGDRGAAELIEAAAAGGVHAALHIGGRDRTLEAGGVVAEAVAVYASKLIAVGREKVAELAGSVALLQSARAARRLAEIVDANGARRSDIMLAALSAAVLRAAGTGWQAVVTAPEPTSEALIDAALALAD